MRAPATARPGRSVKPVMSMRDTGWFSPSAQLRVFHGMLTSHGGALRPCLLEGGLSQPAAQLGQGISLRWGLCHVGQQPAGAGRLQHGIRGGQQADGPAGVLPLGGQRRQPLQVVADARLVPGVAGDRQPLPQESGRAGQVSPGPGC
jgi:hypothetical protein